MEQASPGAFFSGSFSSGLPSYTGGLGGAQMSALTPSPRQFTRQPCLPLPACAPLPSGWDSPSWPPPVVGVRVLTDPSPGCGSRLRLGSSVLCCCLSWHWCWPSVPGTQGGARCHRGLSWGGPNLDFKWQGSHRKHERDGRTEPEGLLEVGWVEGNWEPDERAVPRRHGGSHEASTGGGKA